MSEVSFTPPTKNGGSEGWFMAVNAQGGMHCSCGRELIRVDKDTFKCSAGFPLYRPEKGQVQYDKFGNVMLKIKAHRRKNDAHPPAAS